MSGGAEQEVTELVRGDVAHQFGRRPAGAERDGGDGLRIQLCGATQQERPTQGERIAGVTAWQQAESQFDAGGDVVDRGGSFRIAPHDFEARREEHSRSLPLHGNAQFAAHAGRVMDLDRDAGLRVGRERSKKEEQVAEKDTPRVAIGERAVAWRHMPGLCGQCHPRQRAHLTEATESRRNK